MHGATVVMYMYMKYMYEYMHVILPCHCDDVFVVVWLHAAALGCSVGSRGSGQAAAQLARGRRRRRH